MNHRAHEPGLVAGGAAAGSGLCPRVASSRAETWGARQRPGASEGDAAEGRARVASRVTSGRSGGGADGGIVPAMPALSRTLAVLALFPIAACDLYFRSDEQQGDDIGIPPDASVPPDAFVSVDARIPIDAPAMPPPNPGFVTPGASTRANVLRNGAWADVGAPDWSCLAQPPAEPTSATGYALTGTIRDFASSQSVGGATITASVNGQVIAMGTAGTGGSRGQYRLDLPALPAGVTRVRFTIGASAESRTTVATERYLGQLPVTSLDQPRVSNATATVLAFAVGDTRDPADGLVIGELRDCQGRMVSNAIVALSTSTTFVAHWPGGVTFYFSGAAQGNAPVRHDIRTSTSADGRFMILGPQPAIGAEGTLQAWGFTSQADLASGTLRLLGKSAAVIAPATVSIAQINRARGGSIMPGGN